MGRIIAYGALFSISLLVFEPVSVGIIVGSALFALHIFTTRRPPE